MQSIFWLIPDRLAGRAGPTVARWSLRDLRVAGFDVVLNLSEYAPDDSDFQAAGLRCHWVPLPTTVPPDEEAERECVEALPRAHAILQAELEAGNRALVHCVAGRDRTGMLLTYHLARSRQIEPAAALEQLREVRPNAIAAEGWESMTLRVLARLLATA